MVWDQEMDERREAKAMMDKDVMEMLQGLKIRNSRAVRGLTSLYEAWRGSAADWSPQLAEAISKPKVKGSSKGPKFTVPHPFQMMVREAEKRKKMAAAPWADLHGEQDADAAECVKQFRARPVPAHVFLPMYNEVMEQNEKRRTTGIQERREHLLSMQKPFQLLVQDRKRPVSAPPEPVPHRKRLIPKSVLDPTVSDRLREADILRKINSYLRAKDLLASSCAPVPLSRDIRAPNSRTALKTGQQHLGFLQQNLTFQPHVNQSVPDFHKLYRNFQKLSLKKQKTREPTETEPFNLRTSSRRAKIHSSTEDVQDSVQETPQQRPPAHPSSLSQNTLPVYITDSTKRRDIAIRSSLQERNNLDKKKEKRLRERGRKSLTMQPALSRRAKALDPHKPLAASNKEKLKEMRQADRRRTQEYKEELQEMRQRVNAKEYLFERVSKGCAIKDMERRFTQTLAQAGLTDDFVQQKGREHLEQSESHGRQHHNADSQ